MRVSSLDKCLILTQWTNPLFTMDLLPFTAGSTIRNPRRFDTNCLATAYRCLCLASNHVYQGVGFLSAFGQDPHFFVGALTSPRIKKPAARTAKTSTRIIQSHIPLHTNDDKSSMGIPYFVASIVRAHKGVVKCFHSPYRVDALLIDFNCFLHR